MRYYYLVDNSLDYAVCFTSKKRLMNYAVSNFLMCWSIYYNKKDLPKEIKTIVGNGTCKNYLTKNGNYVIKNSLKDKGVR